jgi:hypothetical protein
VRCPIPTNDHKIDHLSRRLDNLGADPHAIPLGARSVDTRTSLGLLDERQDVFLEDCDATR